MPKAKKKTKGYPYTILPLREDPKKYDRLFPLAVNIYFQIECFLRSPKALQAYRKSQNIFQSLLKKSGINCDPLAGEHHVLMRVVTDPDEKFDDESVSAGFVRNKKTGTVDVGILDLAAVVNLGPSPWWPRGGEAAILELLHSPLPRFVCLRLDISHSPSSIIESLRPLLEERSKQYEKTPPKDALEQMHRENRKTTFRDITAWIKYFQCYDLRHCEDLSYGKIAIKVYGTQIARDRAEQAVRRVSRAIKAAESNTCPPRNPSR